jgi:hypothetical protein
MSGMEQTFPYTRELASMEKAELHERLRRGNGIATYPLNDLATYAGIQRWRRSPAAYGRAPEALKDWLCSQRLALYSRLGNDAVEDDGRRMTLQVLRYLAADDLVVVVDIGSHGDQRLGRALLDGTLVPDLPSTLDQGTQPGTKDDGVRWANDVDVDAVISSCIPPLSAAEMRKLLFGPLFEDGSK